MKKDILLLVMVVIVLGALGAFYLLAPKADSLGYRPVDVGGGSITVANQPDLNAVTLDAELAAPGWITIHENMSGAPAAIIGTSAYLEAGTYNDLVIPLTVEMLPGALYTTLLHIDSGDKRFVAKEDYPVMTNGVVVRPDFTAGEEEGDIVDIPGTDETIIVE